jgi:hypothetical protein
VRKLLASAILVAAMAAPSSALFINGGFEDGTFGGWTLEKAVGSAYNMDYSGLNWQLGNNGLCGVMSAATPNLPGQYVDIDPYNGNFMARLDNLDGNYHAARLTQTDEIETADLNQTIYVNWGAMLVEPSNFHDNGDEPYFGIQILKNGVSINTFTATAYQTTGWTDYGDRGGNAWYKRGTFSFDLGAGGFIVGDDITVQMYVADCGWGGHGAAAFLDGIGTIYQPPQGVPEPASAIMLLVGMAGMGLIRRKKS